jgi:hypothetical protein
LLQKAAFVWHSPHNQNPQLRTMRLSPLRIQRCKLGLTSFAAEWMAARTGLVPSRNRSESPTSNKAGSLTRHCVKTRANQKGESFLWFADSWTRWSGNLFRRGRKAGTWIRWDGQIVSFHVLSRYWIISGRGIKANPAFGIKYHTLCKKANGERKLMTFA